jgi:hypothetical protein
MMLVLTLFVLLATSSPNVTLRAPNLEPITYDATLDAKLDDAWNAFATSKGWKSWAVAQAEVDLRNGGRIRTTYSKTATLGDESTIENTIMCYDPKRMLSFRVTRFPKGFPFPKAVESMWTVIYFESVSENRTKVTVRSMGFTADEESQKMREFFVRGNKITMDALVAHFATKP